MQLTFLGADHEVTGSCHFLQACGLNILLDCGMEQGNDVYENQTLPVDPKDVDYIFLSHAHIDHSGLIPMMYGHGFRGRVMTTEATKDLCEIMLKDSAHIQESEAEWRNRKARRSGTVLQTFVPIYTMEDAVGCLDLFDGCSYDRVYTIADGLKLRFQDVGHLLGSACMEIWITEDDTTKKLVFSGDLGNVDKPITRDPTYNVKEADYVIMESTYGDREHAPEPDYVQFLADVINRTLARGGNVVIPSFAVGRTQELLYFIRELKEQHLEKQDFDVYVDSPLAIEATNIFQENIYGYFDEQALALVKKGVNPLVFPGLKFATTSEESKQINFDPTTKVIISASGMCEAGRIRHHLKHNLWRPECTILFAGYQAAGTTGRAILDGKKEITLFGEPISVKAEIVQIPDSSGHADRDGLIRWLLSIDQRKPEHVFIVHGEDAVCDSFAALLHDRYGYNTTAPYTGMCYDLATGQMLREGNRERKSRRSTAKQRRAEGVFARLVAAGERLMDVIRHNEGGANKDLARFTNQINILCDKWDR